MTLLLDFIRNQRNAGFAPIILFVGRQRIGKTALAMTTASEIQTSWNPKELMMFKIEEFADAYDMHDNSILILDEAGVSLDPYEHASITQRVYNHIIQTQAYKSNIVFLVLPFASEIGKVHRKHVDAIVEVVGRGVYKLYRTRTWRSDLSNKPPRLEIIEIVCDVPLPKKEIWDWYKLEGQNIYKKSIMEMQKEMLKMKNAKMSYAQPQRVASRI